MEEVYRLKQITGVAPHAGAWIEISLLLSLSSMMSVAPHAGAWIEIDIRPFCKAYPSNVAPHAGAWIEMNGA